MPPCTPTPISPPAPPPPSCVLHPRRLCGRAFRFYQFIDYTALYGNGGTLCYRVEPCVQMLAIQNTCGVSCCRDGAEGDAAFAYAAANHNYASDVGPGPWLVARLDEFDEANTTNFGAGEWDVYPCPLQPVARDFSNRQRLGLPNTAEVLSRWSAPGFACDPSTCTGAPYYPNTDYGCYRCNEVSRVAYVVTRCTDDAALHLTLEVTDTKQRWQTDAYGACFYVVEQLVHCLPDACELVPQPPLPPFSPPPAPPPFPVSSPPLPTLPPSLPIVGAASSSLASDSPPPAAAIDGDVNTVVLTLPGAANWISIQIPPASRVGQVIVLGTSAGLLAPSTWPFEVYLGSASGDISSPRARSCDGPKPEQANAPFFVIPCEFTYWRPPFPRFVTVLQSGPARGWGLAEVAVLPA